MSEENLQKLREYASLLLSYSDICILLDIPVQEFIVRVTNPTTPEFRAYQLGQLDTEIEVRRQIIENAKMGSPAAQEQSLKLLKDTNIKNSEHE